MIKTVLKIDGMMCGMCEAHVNDAIRKSIDVKKVTSSHKNGTTEIISEKKPDEEKIKEAIKETGYTLENISYEEYEKKGFSLFKKNK